MKCERGWVYRGVTDMNPAYGFVIHDEDDFGYGYFIPEDLPADCGWDVRSEEGELCKKNDCIWFKFKPSKETLVECYQNGYAELLADAESDVEYYKRMNKECG